MAESIVSTVTEILGLIPTMATNVYTAFTNLFITGTGSSATLNALGIWAVCGMGIGMVIGIVHFAQKLFGRTR